MARTNGAYSRPSNSFSNPVAGTAISPTDADSLFDDIETALDVIAIRDDKFSIVDNSDPTKVVAFQASGVTTGTTRTLTVPDANTTIVGTDATQTLTNKTITISDANLTVQDNGDATKQMQLQLSGITTGNTRTLTVPDASTTIVGHDATQTLTNKTMSGASNTFSNLGTSTLSDDAVTYAKIQNVSAAARLLGRHTSGAGDTEELTGAQAMSILGQFGGYNAPFNAGLVAAAAAGALDISLARADGSSATATNQIVTNFRRPTASQGYTDSVIQSAALTLTLPSGAELGVSASVPPRIWIVLFNDGGTLRLGAINCRTAARPTFQLRDGLLASSSAVGTGSDSAHTFYTDSAVTTKAYRIIGYLEWASAITPGTWTTPDIVQLFGPGVPLPGTVVQATVGSTTTRGTASTSTSYTATGVTLSGSITPSSAANGVRVTVHGSVGIGVGGANGGHGVNVRTIRSGSSVQVGANWSGFVDPDGANEGAGVAQYVSDGYDFPASTSAVTYTPQVKTNNAATDVLFPYGDTTDTNAVGYMIMEEIMA